MRWGRIGRQGEHRPAQPVARSLGRQHIGAGMQGGGKVDDAWHLPHQRLDVPDRHDVVGAESHTQPVVAQFHGRFDAAGAQAMRQAALQGLLEADAVAALEGDLAIVDQDAALEGRGGRERGWVCGGIGRLCHHGGVSGGWTGQAG